jgi:uncharacterized tellurite resistance protein B-like protein
MDRVALFKNLIVMASADGRMSQGEVEMLSVRAERWGLSEADVAAAIEHAKGADFETLRELIRVMAADGEMSEIEKRLLALASVAMEIEPEEFDEILDTM